MSILASLGRVVRNPLPPVYHGVTARLFHWIAVVAVAGAFATAFADRLVPELWDAAIALHRQIGIAILALTAVRFLWRSQYRAPLSAHPLPRAMHGVSVATQSLLYACLMLQPMLGWLYTNARNRDVVLLGFVRLPRLMPGNRPFAEIVQDWHAELGLVLAGLIGLHIAGALYHHFVRRDGLLLAMLPGRRHPRFEVAGDARVDVAGTARACRLLDISAGGARLAGLNGLAAGQRGVLAVDGLACQPAFLVVAAEGDRLRIGFALDSRGQLHFERALADFVAADPRVRRLVPSDATKARRQAADGSLTV